MSNEHWQRAGLDYCFDILFNDCEGKKPMARRRPKKGIEEAPIVLTLVCTFEEISDDCLREIQQAIRAHGSVQEATLVQQAPVKRDVTDVW